MKNILIFSIVILFSCNSVRSVSSNNEAICNPIKVTLDGKNDGYIIKNKDFDIKKEDAELIIKSFENIIFKDYGNFYNKYYRQYFFYLNKNGEIILNLLYLNKKEIQSNPNWKCLYHEVGLYRRPFKKNYPSSYFYNYKTKVVSINSL